MRWAKWRAPPTWSCAGRCEPARPATGGRGWHHPPGPLDTLSQPGRWQPGPRTGQDAALCLQVPGICSPPGPWPATWKTQRKQQQPQQQQQQVDPLSAAEPRLAASAYSQPTSLHSRPQHTAPAWQPAGAPGARRHFSACSPAPPATAAATASLPCSTIATPSHNPA